MNIIQNTKTYFGERAIRSYLKTSDRQVSACNLVSAKSIGILFNATYQVSFEIVKEMVKNLSTKNNSIDVLGYVDSKQLIDHYLYRKGFDFFTHKQLNWFYKPETESVNKFIKKPFDILINLSLDEPYPIQYILATSKARFKVGKYSEEQPYLDLMIDLEKEKATMNDLKTELEKDLAKVKLKNKDVEKIIDKKIQTEMQMNFLINQLIHYLSLIKN
ncbi:MAG: hypothetical protein JW894_01770 [Bacteroidales bacterium]|nr:hypothetical protein [Bacteroidales bacterium]